MLRAVRRPLLRLRAARDGAVRGGPASLARAAAAPVVVSAARARGAARGARARLAARRRREVERALAAEVDDELLYRGRSRAATSATIRWSSAAWSRTCASRAHRTRATTRRCSRRRSRWACTRATRSCGAAWSSACASISRPRRRAPNPTEAELREYYERNAATLSQPGARALHAALLPRRPRARARAARSRGCAPRDAARARARALGDPFLHPPSSRSRRATSSRAASAPSFAEGVFAAPPGAWSGPIPSAYGVHLVFVHEREAPRALAFEEVRDSVRHAVIAERRRTALERGLRALRDSVRVVIEAPDQPPPSRRQGRHRVSALEGR